MAFSIAIAPRRLEMIHSLSVSLCKELVEVGGGKQSTREEEEKEKETISLLLIFPPFNLLGLHMSLWVGMRT